MDVRFILFSRWGEQLEELSEIRSASHKQEINGEDTLSLSVNYPLAKGDRILWQDTNAWYEHVVSEPRQCHSSAETYDFVCESAAQADLRLAQISTLVAKQVTAREALALLLGQTTWSVGIVDDFGAADLIFDHCNVYEGLINLVGTFGCEYYSSLEIGSSGVVTRKINLVNEMGADKGVRFEYGSDLSGVTKSVLSDDVFSACYGYGANLDTTTDGVTDRLTFSSVNDGVPYVADDFAKTRWGLPDGIGGVMHSFGRYENTSCDDAKQLLAETMDYLAVHSKPSVSYETDIPFASLKGVMLGDTVQVVDVEFTPPLALEARIGALDRDLLAWQTSSATFGTVVSVLPDVLARTYAAVRDMRSATQSINPESIMSGMNNVYAGGGSNVYQSADKGIITANVALDEKGNPKQTSGKIAAVQLVGGTLRTASSVDTAGKWNWTGELSVGADGLLYNGKKLMTEE